MRRAAFTALELVVALAIAGLAATVGAGTLAILVDHGGRLADVVTPVERATAVRRSLVEWLEGVRSLPTPPDAPGGISRPTFQLLDRTNRGQPADELLFETSASTPAGRGVLVRLYVDDDRRTPERGLVAEFRAGAGDRVARAELDPEVASFDVRCLTDLLGARRWVSTWVSSAVVPRGVEVRLHAARSTSLHPLLARPILVALEQGR